MSLGLGCGGSGVVDCAVLLFVELVFDDDLGREWRSFGGPAGLTTSVISSLLSAVGSAAGAILLPDVLFDSIVVGNWVCEPS